MVLAPTGHVAAHGPQIGNAAQSKEGTDMSDIDTTPLPHGDLALQTVAMPKDTNANGDIFGGWLLSQMDIAGMITASEVADGRVATVAINGMAFLTPVHVGAVVSCYCDVLETGRSSIRIIVEVWINSLHDREPIKVTEGEFVFVAIDENGRTRAIQH
jgi:acyl-CoA thioesterase YciA